MVLDLGHFFGISISMCVLGELLVISPLIYTLW